MRNSSNHTTRASIILRHRTHAFSLPIANNSARLPRRLHALNRPNNARKIPLQRRSTQQVHRSSATMHIITLRSRLLHNTLKNRPRNFMKRRLIHNRTIIRLRSKSIRQISAQYYVSLLNNANNRIMTSGNPRILYVGKVHTVNHRHLYTRSRQNVSTITIHRYLKCRSHNHNPTHQKTALRTHRQSRSHKKDRCLVRNRPVARSHVQVINNIYTHLSHSPHRHIQLRPMLINVHASHAPRMLHHRQNITILLRHILSLIRTVRKA